MILNVLLIAYTLFVIVSSIWFGTTTSTTFLLVSASLFALSLIIARRKPQFRFFRVAALVMFHWSSQFGWCLPLYLLLGFKECYRIHRLPRVIATLLFFSCLYFAIHIPTLSGTIMDNILVILYDVASFIVLILAVCYLIKMEREKRLLATRDPLTGLLNFQEYHRQLESILKKADWFVLLLIDCTDLKSMNDEQGYQGGNQILIKVANFLRNAFSDAYFIAHYGGDEFAIAVKIEDQRSTINHLMELIDVRFPNELKVKITYGYAVYPHDGHIKDTLVSTAEQRLFAMKRDIWLKREEQKLRAEKLKLIGELAAGIAHEIRNPLTTVRGFLQLTKQNDYNIQPWYDLVMEETSRVSELTAEFLQLSKPHATQFKIQPLQECIQRVVSLTTSEATYLGHEIRCEPLDRTIYARIDKDKMVQLMINLVRNAFEAMDEGGIVTIRLYRERERAVVEVNDTGSGIPESQVDKIFNPFYTTKETGAGLGLSVCHQIMHVHHGAIDVKSTGKTGTSFRLHLPLIPADMQDEPFQAVL